MRSYVVACLGPVQYRCVDQRDGLHSFRNRHRHSWQDGCAFSPGTERKSSPCRVIRCVDNVTLGSPERKTGAQGALAKVLARTRTDGVPVGAGTGSLGRSIPFWQGELRGRFSSMHCPVLWVSARGIVFSRKTCAFGPCPSTCDARFS